MAVNKGSPNILFDIGVVLLNIDYDRAVQKMLPRCDPGKVGNSRCFFTLINQHEQLAAFERGTVSSQDFFHQFVALTGFSGSIQRLIDIWRDIFSENAGMIAFGWELAQRHNVYFMTNAGPWHVPYIYDAFPNLCFFKDDAVSCYLHAVKPEIEFYRRALGKFGIDKKTCIFVDDRPENVKGAQAFGLHSIPYTHTAETIHAVRDAINQFQDRRV